MWSDKSKSDVLIALERLERGAMALRARVEWGDGAPEDVLAAIEGMRQELRDMHCAASWDRFPEDVGS